MPASIDDPERRRPRRLTSAPASIDTVAAFRPWRDFRSSVARGRRGHHRRASVGSRRGNWRREGIHSALRASPFGRLRRANRYAVCRTHGGSHPLSLPPAKLTRPGASLRFQTWRREGDSLGATRLALRAASPCKPLRGLSNPRGFSPPLLAAGETHAAWSITSLSNLAERGGFEPPKRGLDAYTLSRRAPSTTRTPLRWIPRGAVLAACGAGNSSLRAVSKQETMPAAGMGA
jgi:hypothetical protein